MKPGIYVFQDGGLSLGAQSKLFTIAANKNGATAATWATTDCPTGSCGVLMYKTTVSSTDQITVTAGATFMARAFNPDADTTVLTGPGTYDKESYRNLLIWQDASPIPTGPPNSAYAQPSIQLQGGGNAADIDGEHAVPLREVQRLGLAPGRHQPGVGDDDVEPAEARDRRGEGDGERGLVGDVGRQCDEPGRRCGCRDFGGEVEGSAPRALGGEGADDRLPEAATSPGDQRHAIRQQSAHSRPLASIGGILVN